MENKHCYWCGSTQDEVLNLIWDKHANSIREMKKIKIQPDSCFICPECQQAEDYKADFQRAKDEGFIDV